MFHLTFSQVFTDLYAPRVFVVVDVALGVVGDELLGLCAADGGHRLEEFLQLLRA